MPLKPQRINIPINGGLNQGETPEYVDPPALSECENMYHDKSTALVKRNGVSGYPIVVDATGALITSWVVGPNIPLVSCPIDRFLNSDDAPLFAARGWLWSYVPEVYVGNQNYPLPNAIRHGEIPDLQVDVSPVFGVDNTSNTGLSIIDTASASAANDLLCTTYLLHSTGSYYEWWVKVTSRSTGLLVVEQRLTYSFTHAFSRPCAVAYPGGFMVTILDSTAQAILAWRYSFDAGIWVAATMPGLTLHAPEGGGPYSPAFYDACGTGTNDVHIAYVVSSGVFTIVGAGDPIDFVNGLFVCTLDASSMTIKYGGYYIGEHAIRSVGCMSYVPMFAVAGDGQGNYGVVWSDGIGNNIKFLSSNGNTLPNQASILTLDVPNYPIAVALGFVAPTKQVDVMWNALWEKSEIGLIAGGGYLNTVYSQTITSTRTTIFQRKAYFATRISSNPWCELGNSYALLVPNQPIPAGCGASFADVPWVIARTWCDQDRMETDAANHSYQFPMAVWGYGTTFRTTQPYRVQLDSSNRFKAFGAVVTTDPFTQFSGSTVVNLTLDPTGPDRYESAPLPGGGVVFGCAQPWVFDGDTPFEAAFIMRPWSVSSTVGSGGSLGDDSLVPDGSHYLQIIYEHEDAKGRIYRSAVSETIAVATNSTYKTIMLQVTPPFWTARKPLTCTVKVYMCTDAVSFALAAIAPVVTYHPGDTPAFIQFSIANEPTAIPAAPKIYTFDGSLESGYPQLASHVVRWNNRIWIADKNQASYSHAFISGDGVSFPDTLTEYVDKTIKGFCPMDDRLILFTPDSVAYRNGEGPSQNGAGASYSNWNYFTHEVGCVNSRSVLRTMVGIFFQSRRHLEFMDNSCQVTHQLAIEDLFQASSTTGQGQAILGGISLPRDHQARFMYYDAAGVVRELAINYLTVTWSRWSGAYQWVGSAGNFWGDTTVVGDTVYMVDANGTLYVENENQQFDSNNPVSAPSLRRHIDWSVKTPWIKLDGLQGVQRVWRSEIALRCTPWSQPASTVPQFGVTVNVDVDYHGCSELHDALGIVELAELSNADGLTYLRVGHIEQQCRGYQLQMSSSDPTDHAAADNPTGVTEILGIWSELGIEPGTGRGRAERNI